MWKEPDALKQAELEYNRTHHTGTMLEKKGSKESSFFCLSSNSAARVNGYKYSEEKILKRSLYCIRFGEAQVQRACCDEQC